MREAGERSIAKGEGGDKEGGGSMCHCVGQDGCMPNLTKASNVLCALFVLHGVCVCVYGVGGCHFHEANKEHPRKWVGSYPRTPTP